MRILFTKSVAFLKKYKKYVVLNLIFLSIVMISFIVMCCNIESSDVVAISSAVISIFGGALASVVVAWLIEIYDRKQQKEKNETILNFCLQEFREAVWNYCYQYCCYCCEYDRSLTGENLSFIKWVDIYINQIQNGRKQAKKTYSISAIEPVEDAFLGIRKNKLMFLNTETITIEKYKEIRELSEIISSFKIHYMISDVEINTVLIKEAADMVDKQIKSLNWMFEEKLDCFRYNNMNPYYD